MHKTLIIKELKDRIALRVNVKHDDGRSATVEVATFRKSGMGWVTLGAAGRELVKGLGYVDELMFDGHEDTYKMLVTLGVIEPMQAAA